MQGALGRGFRLPALDQVVYSARAGAALRMLMELRGPTTASRGVGLVVRVAGSSPMARHLAALGLDGASPLLVQACRRGQMVFRGAEPLGRARGG